MQTTLSTVNFFVNWLRSIQIDLVLIMETAYDVNIVWYCPSSLKLLSAQEFFELH